MTETAKLEALKPCPFCGSHLVRSEFQSTRYLERRCHPEDSECILNSIVISMDDEEYANERRAAWNTRALSVSRPAVKGLEDVKAALIERVKKDGPLVAWEIEEVLSSLSPPTGGWKGLESAPLKRTIVVGRHDWDNVTTVNWANETAKAADLANWSSPPTHWLDGVTLPSPLEAE